MSPIKADEQDEPEEFATPQSSNPQEDACYIGYGKPEITPVPRIKRRVIPNSHNLKAFLHTPSLSPRQIVQEKHRIRSNSFSNRISTASFSETQKEAKSDEQRLRHSSESDVASLKTKTHQGQGGSLKYKRYQVGDKGLYECDGHPFELRDRSLIEESGISYSDLQSEIKAALRDISPEITPGQTRSRSTELFWRPCMIKQICDNLPQRSKNGISVPSNPEDKGSLMLLLATLNNCINAATGLNVLFNGIRIIYSFDRASRTQLKNVNNGDNLPLAILHMGKARESGPKHHTA